MADETDDFWPPPPAPPTGSGWSNAAPPPPPPPPPPVGTSPRRSRAVPAVAVAVTGALAVVVVAIATRAFDAGPPHPDTWDPRVTELVAFVEEDRGLTFDHPVYVDFLAASDYTKASTEEESAIAPQDRTELDRYAGELRALGLASGELDLFAAFNAVSDGGTLAFYDPVQQRVMVRGTTMTVGLRVTLVHELTHALQDQHFDLDRLYDSDLDDGAATAFRALIEGDALRIENDYTSDELSASEQDAYDEEYASQLEESKVSTRDVPPYVNASFGVPYLLGQPFVTMLSNDGGNRAVDRAFRTPPDTEEHLFDPASFLSREKPRRIDLALAKGVKVLDDGRFGSPSWYLLLAERIDPIQAFDAALGWGGDAYAVFERGGRACIRAGFVGDSRADESEMTEALDAWSAAMPGGRAKSIDVDGHPGLEACDPGTTTDMALSGRAETALNVPSLWGYLVADAATALDADGTRCYARAVLDDLTYAQITDPAGAVFETDDFQRTLTEAFRRCS